MPEVALEEAQRFMVDSLRAAGAPLSEAKQHAALLLHADKTGHYSHGLNRLELYINDIKSGATKPAAEPVILKESAATAWVDGCDALGATVGNFCMDLAIWKAKECGVGWVSVKRCNHFGMAGWWAQKAKLDGLIGMAFTNSSPIMVPTRAKSGAMGTNPIAMCAPATDGDSLLVDMASTAVAMGKIEVQIHKEEPIPEGWALGPDGKTTTDSNLAFETGKLLPLGGFEQSSGYKGYCLSAMVEAFCSGLSGSKSSHNVRGWALDSQEGAPNLGQCYVAIDPDCFAPGFGERIADCLRHWRGMEPVDSSLPVLAPGDKERNNERQSEKRGVISYAQGQIDTCSKPSHNIRVWTLDSQEGATNIGQCYVAIYLDCFAPGFGERIADCLRHWRGMEPVDPSLPVLAPGDKERNNERQSAKRGVISYAQGQIDTCNALTKILNIKQVGSL